MKISNSLDIYFPNFLVRKIFKQTFLHLFNKTTNKNKLSLISLYCLKNKKTKLYCCKTGFPIKSLN